MMSNNAFKLFVLVSQQCLFCNIEICNTHTDKQKWLLTTDPKQIFHK